MAKEIWNGPYSYLEMSFHEQNKALVINDPTSPGYMSAARYMISDLGNVKVWRDPRGFSDWDPAGTARLHREL